MDNPSSKGCANRGVFSVEKAFCSGSAEQYPTRALQHCRNSSGLLWKGAFYNPDSNRYGNDAGACAMDRRSYAYRQSPCPTRVRKAWMEKGRDTDLISQMADTLATLQNHGPVGNPQ